MRARFGDGEFTVIAGRVRHKFQTQMYEGLKRRLLEVLHSENAFSNYEQILSCCLRQPKDRLFLLALGSAATVLAYDLCQAGYQAVDIGHIDLEYEWFLKGEGHRTMVRGKYNNEMEGGDKPDEIADERYREQIIADCSR